MDYDPDTKYDSDNVFKIFSRRELSREEIDDMFEDVEHVTSVPWLAYPEYTTQDDLTAFELAPGLFYL